VTPLGDGLLAVALVAAVVDWAAVWTGGARSRAVERVAKPLVLLALLGVALTWPVDTGGIGVRPWLVVALAASLAGDVLLLPPGRFVGGLVAFLVAHLAYLGAFLQVPGEPSWLVAGVVVASILVLTVGRLLVAAASRVGLGAPVAIYLLAICAMAVAATRTGLPAAILGAWLFVASDSMLGWSRFKAAASWPERGPAALRVAVMVTYHTGQVMLVLALVG
jgi:uncharacterized membrane protein YhhN